MSFLAPVMPFLQTAGAVVVTVGTIASGAYQAQIANNNAKIAEQNAAYARQAGQEQAAQESRKAAVEQGAIRTAIAANNVDVNTGSAADVQAGAREIGKLDAETVLNNAELSAYGYTTQANNYRAQASQDMAGGILGGLGTLLSNAKGLNLKWGGSSGVGDPMNIVPAGA